MEKPAETSTPNNAKHSINWGALFLWPVVILILYAFSIGPAVMITDKSDLGQYNKLIGKYCFPYAWAWHSTPLHKPLGMYLHLWVPKHFDKNGDIPFAK